MSIPINIIYPQLDRLTVKDRQILQTCAFELMVKLTDKKQTFTEADAYELPNKIGMKIARKAR